MSESSEDTESRSSPPADGAPAPVATWDWDIVADRVTWSDGVYDIYGLEPREFRASFQAYMERIHPGDRERISLILGQAMRDHRPFDFQHHVRRPDGSVRTIQAHGTVHCDASGKPVRMSGTSQDITGT